MPMNQEVSTERRAEEKLLAKMKTEDMRTGAQPMPMRPIETMIAQGAVASARSTAPLVAKPPNSNAAVRRGPKRSNQMPTATGISATTTNRGPDGAESSAFVAPHSCERTGVRTARKGG